MLTRALYEGLDSIIHYSPSSRQNHRKVNDHVQHATNHRFERKWVLYYNSTSNAHHSNEKTTNLQLLVLISTSSSFQRWPLSKISRVEFTSCIIPDTYAARTMLGCCAGLCVLRKGLILNSCIHHPIPTDN